MVTGAEFTSTPQKEKERKEDDDFLVLKCLRIHLLFHSQSKNIQLAPSHAHIQQQKATGHITSLLTDSDAHFGCKMPTTSSDKKEIMFLITPFSSLFF